LKFIAESPSDLPQIARQIWARYGSRRIFAFYGNLGAGKTAIIRALCDHLGVDSEVSSPTFAIVNEYAGERTVYHIDLYRLDKRSQVMEIGMDDYLNSKHICFIEWPQLIEDVLPGRTVRIRMDVGAGGERTITVSTNE
jgi:tRNA threonylcarbamoyladenosine biosynthesis protein TsaE